MIGPVVEGGFAGNVCRFSLRVATLRGSDASCGCCDALQTGSGKTHSIIGPRVGQEVEGSEDDGLLNRAFRYAFDAIAASEDTEFETAVTCAELYNDQVTQREN